jgi:hypothetical protein
MKRSGRVRYAVIGLGHIAQVAVLPHSGTRAQQRARRTRVGRSRQARDALTPLSRFALL